MQCSSNRKAPARPNTMESVAVRFASLILSVLLPLDLEALSEALFDLRASCGDTVSPLLDAARRDMDEFVV